VKKVLLATRNRKKLIELQRILDGALGAHRIALLGLDDVEEMPELPETGLTFGENALTKAREACRRADLPTVADDSGLAVDALNGMPGVLSARWAGAAKSDEANLELVLAQVADLPDERLTAAFVCAAALNGMPGVFSARWAGRHGDDRANLELLLAQVSDVPDEHRKASFVCAVALVLPGGKEHLVEGRQSGRLLRAPRGEGGFGYDPIFLGDGQDRTNAELTPQEKDAISHRGKALRELSRIAAKYLLDRPM
jgi:XTP/dITP diphosphohydrolase